MAGEIIHNRLHDIDDTNDHNGVSGAVEDNVPSFDGNGLIKDSGEAASDIHAESHTVESHSDVDVTGRKNKSRMSWSVSGNDWEMGDPEAEKVIELAKSAVDGMAVNDVVYIFGQDTGTTTIKKAKADSMTTMPAWGIAMDAGDTGDDIRVLVLGGLNSSNTSTYTIRDSLYVSAATAGEWTNVKPIGAANAIQKIAVVKDVAVSGNVYVSGANRVNDIPNLAENNVWNGDSNGVPQATNTPTLTGTNFSGIPDSAIDILKIGTPTYTNLQQLHNLLNSAGLLANGTIITDAGGATVDLAASKCLIRITDADTGDLKSVDISSASAQAITTDSIRYIGVEYNAGSPQYLIKTTDSWNGNTEFRIGSVVNEGGTLHVVNNPQKSSNGVRDILHRLFEAEPMQRADRLGGLILGETGTRNITVSGSEIYDQATEFPITALDTSVTGGFDSYYDTTKQDTAATQWDNMYYNNAGTRTEMTVGRYANLWFYAELDDSIVMEYGTGQYTSAAGAQAEGVPATIPNRLQAHGKLIGRLIFLKSAATATIIESAFSAVFTGAGAADHGDLAGLADDDHTQYSLLSSQAGTPTSTPSRVGEINVDTTNDRVWQSVGTASAGDWVLVNNRFIVWRLLDQSTDHVVDTNIAGDLRLPLAYKIKNVWAYADTAGTGSVTTVDINEAGTTILSTKITIDATEDHSKDAAIPPVISDSAIAAWAKVTADIDGIASGTAGKGITLVFEIDFTG